MMEIPSSLSVLPTAEVAYLLDVFLETNRRPYAEDQAMVYVWLRRVLIARSVCPDCRGPLPEEITCEGCI